MAQISVVLSVGYCGTISARLEAPPSPRDPEAVYICIFIYGPEYGQYI